LYIKLTSNRKLDAKGQAFLNRHTQDRTKWERAYDENGWRYGQMISNMAECFNKVLKGVCALPVTAIVRYTFDKLNEYFFLSTQMKWIGRLRETIRESTNTSTHPKLING
jgi:hypothetical protein